jgi:hypothetical protein
MRVPQVHARHRAGERQVRHGHLVLLLGIRLDELVAAYGRHGAAAFGSMKKRVGPLRDRIIAQPPSLALRATPSAAAGEASNARRGARRARQHQVVEHFDRVVDLDQVHHARHFDFLGPGQVPG